MSLICNQVKPNVHYCNVHFYFDSPPCMSVSEQLPDHNNRTPVFCFSSQQINLRRHHRLGPYFMLLTFKRISCCVMTFRVSRITCRRLSLLSRYGGVIIRVVEDVDTLSADAWKKGKKNSLSWGNWLERD